MHGSKASLVLWATIATVTATTATAGNANVSPSSCQFSDYITHPLITSYEFQLDVPANRCTGWSLSQQLDNVETLLLSTSPHPLMLYPRSRRTSVIDQFSAAISTLDGRSIFSSLPFPWKGPAFLRHRLRYKTTGHAHNKGERDAYMNGTCVQYVRAGAGDLTLKIKDIDLDHFIPLHRQLHFPCRHHRRSTCGGVDRRSKLKFKIENDRYCSQGRATYEAMFRPVDVSHDEISTIDTSNACFPGLSEYVHWSQSPSRTLTLPEYNRRSFSKSVWDVDVKGVAGVVNWVATYDTLLDALTGGGNAVECELSFRLKNQSKGDDVHDGPHSIHRHHKGGELKEALDALVAVCDELHAKGWDTGVH